MQADHRFKKGLELFNRQAFFECHEVLEELWLEAKDRNRDLYKGVIQAAVALHHLKMGNLGGALNLFRSAIHYLEKYRPHALGLNVEKLIQDMELCFKMFEGWDDKRKLEMGSLTIPTLEYE